MSKLFVAQSNLLSSDATVSDHMSFSDLSNCHDQESLQIDGWTLSESHRKDAPLGGSRLFSNDHWAVVFAGDLIDHETVPFEQLISALEKSRWDFLAELSGIFAFVAYERQTRKTFAVSDRRSQKPLFYEVGTGGLRVSTDPSVLVRHSGDPQFDKRWFWEVIYFNFPIADTTYLRNVRRLPPASVLSYKSRSGEVLLKNYAELFKPRDPLFKRDEALELATGLFATRVPAHYRGSCNVACALTAGWDGRTVLALAPSDKEITAYTYGVPGCDDLAGAAATAEATGVNHVEIPFERNFAHEMPHHALETVYLSGGLQGVLRSTLNHMYDALTNSGQRFSLIVSGISLGTQIRGHAQFPDLISPELAQRFQGLGPAHTRDHWRTIVGKDNSEFSEHIQSRLEMLKDQFGPFDRAEHHLSYTVYPLSTHHFCGELSIADRFTTVRVPAWDLKLLDLLYSIELSMLSFSQFVSQSQRVRREEMILQAHVLRELAPNFFRVPVNGIHPANVLAGEFPYQAERTYRAVQRQFAHRLLSRRPAPLENWKVWLFDQNRQFVDELLRSTETLIGDIVELSVIDQTIATRNMRLLGKLLTTEIILRLIKTRWQRFW